jgi:hypothetical protein
MGGVLETALAEWAALMDVDAVRMLFEAALGTIFMLAAWVIGQVPLLQSLPREAKRYFPGVAAAVGIPMAAFLAALIPGSVALELMGAFGLGGGATHWVNQGAKKKGWDDATTRIMTPKRD